MRSIQSTLFSLLVASSAICADTQLNLTAGATKVSQNIYELHMMVFWVCVAIGLIVFALMFYSIFQHRKSKGAKAATFHSNLILEIIWTLIPIIILALMAIPASKVLLEINNNDAPDLTIKVTAYQWKWHYEYLEHHLSFYSNLATPLAEIHNQAPKSIHYLLEVDHPLVVPVHKKIRFLFSSNDVNHSWWVPELGIKRDALPGMINEASASINHPGIYRGQCAELCGINHAFMPIVVEALPEKDFQQWLTQQSNNKVKLSTQAKITVSPKHPSQHTLASRTPPNNKESIMIEAMKNGEKVYQAHCSVCHQPTGIGVPPIFPALKASPIATGPLPPHIQIVLFGKKRTAMQAFKDQLNDQDLADVITYERNAWGNNKGDVLSLAEIKAARDAIPTQ